MSLSRDPRHEASANTDAATWRAASACIPGTLCV